MRNSPKTAEELHAELRALVNRVCSYFDCPENCPMTDAARIAFVISVANKARELRDSEPFAAEELSSKIAALSARNLSSTVQSGATVKVTADFSGPVKKRKS